MSKIKFRFFTIADYEDEEQWLRQQHLSGLRFDHLMLPCFYVFESDVPQDVIYRLDYKNNRETADYLQMLQDYGWKYHGKCTGWLILSKPASQIANDQEGEIFSDNQSRMEMISHVLKTRLFPVALIFFAFLIPQWFDLIREPESHDPRYLLLFTAMGILYLLVIAHCGLKLNHLRKKYNCK